MNRIPRRVGPVLAAVQFVSALCWIVQLACLPQLMQQLGLPPAALLWLLLLEHLVVAVCTMLTGVVADRLARRHARIGPAVFATTLLAALALGLLPSAAAHGATFGAAALAVVWAAASPVLRAPPLVLIACHATRERQPGLIGAAVFGLGAAAAIAPYLERVLIEHGPQRTLGVAAAALALVGLGLLAVERDLIGRAVPDADGALEPSPAGRTPNDAALPPAARLRPTQQAALVAATLLAALALELHLQVNSAVFFRRHAAAGDVAYLTPVFWVGFILLLLPATLWIKRWGGMAVATLGAALAGVIAVMLPQVPALQMLLNLQFLIGGATACCLLGALAFAATSVPGHAGRLCGALASMPALVALLHLGWPSVAVQSDSVAAAFAVWFVGLAWFGAAAIAAVLRRC